jgi:hypothetical protein
VEVSKSAWIVNSILTPLGLLYPFQNGKGMIYPFGVGYCPMLADRSFHNLYSGEKAIVPRQFIKTLITNATSGNKLTQTEKNEADSYDNNDVVFFGDSFSNIERETSFLFILPIRHEKHISYS